MWLWDSRTHQFIVGKALEKSPASFRNLLDFHQEYLILGIEAPDRIFKDFTNHYFNCTPNKFGVHAGSAIKKIAKELTLLRQQTGSPQKIVLHPKIAPFLKLLLNTPLKAFIFELGVLSHYIADLHQPLHTDGKERFQDEETVHKILEADTRLHLKEFSIKMQKKRFRIKNPLSYFETQVYLINKNYDQIIENYYLSHGKVKPTRWKRTFPIIEYCLQKAARNIANIFLDFENASAIFANELKKEKLLDKVRKNLSSQNKYKFVLYPSGTVSLKRRLHHPKGDEK